MELIYGSETSAFKNQSPGIHPKDYSQYSKHSESLKSRIVLLVFDPCAGRGWVVNATPRLLYPEKET
jgi:hypothetical protein